MPPARYAYVALGLIGLFALSFKLTMGFSIFLFYGVFWAAAVVLALGGIYRCGNALAAPPELTFGLMSPILLKVGTLVTLYRGLSNPQFYHFETLISPIFDVLGAVAAIRIIEIVYERNWLTVTAYGVLATLLAVVSMKTLPIAAVSDFLRTAAGRTSYQVVSVVDAGVRGAVFAGAALVVFALREIEFWIVVAIGLAAVEEIVSTALTPVAPFSMGSPTGGGAYAGAIIWLRPVFLAVAAAAIWRAGEMLRLENRLRAIRNAS